MIKRRKTLPALSPKAPAELRPLFAAMAEILETGEGVRGDKLDRKITLRDLLDSGVAKLRVNNNPDAGIIKPDITIDIPVDMSVPPRPLGFSADGSFFGMIHLSWDLPEDQYDNHSLTNIYRNEQDNFATADIVGREPGMFYSDLVRNDVTSVDDPLNLPGYYYWITFTSKSDVEGPPNSPDGTYAQAIPDAAYILGQISGQLSESALSQALSDRINKIDGPASLGGSVANRLEAEANARAQAISTEVNARTQAMASQNLSLTNSINAERDSRIAAIASGIGSAKDYADAKITIEQQARSDGFGALATQIEQIEAGLGDDYTVGMAIEKQARIDGDSALASNILTLTSYAQGVAADVVSEQQARSSADGALAADITKLYVESGDLKGEVSNEAAARINGDKVLSSVQQVISAANTVGSAALKVSSQVFIDENSAMAIKTEELRVSTSQADALIRSDMLTLAGPDSALANSVTSIRADVDNNSSLITEESTARANAVSAANDKITTLESEVGDSISIINTSLQTLANKDTAMSERLDITEAALGDNTSAIQSEATARADAVTALTNQVNLAQSSVDDSLATIVQNASTQASEITAIAQQVTTVASEVNDSLAVVEEDIRTLVTADSLLAERIDNIQVGSSEEYARIEQIAKVGGETGRVNSKMIENLSAQYTVKLDVNGYVSGFGAYNDGATADFAVLADRFWIASPGLSGQKIHPFMVVGNKVYIDSAFFRDASIQEGKLGPITFGKIFDSTGSPITTIGGKLRVDMIDTNSLRVGTANMVDASITTAKIRALSVDTLQLAGRAVTIPVTSSTAGELMWNTTPRAWKEIQRVTVNSTGQIAVIIASAEFYTVSNEIWFAVRIRRGGTEDRVLWESRSRIGFRADRNFSNLFTFNVEDTPPEGRNVYILEVIRDRTGFDQGMAANRSLLYMELKR